MNDYLTDRADTSDLDHQQQREEQQQLEDEQWQVLEGDNCEVLKQFPDNYFDSIVTDPPYGIDFLGKDWDANTGALETYQECLRVLKPGGHILAFSAARTYHHLAITLEQAGFEIRDQIMWIYSSGFPKSQDIGRSIQRSLGVEEHYTLEEYEKLTGVTNLPSTSSTFGHNNDADGQKSAGLSGKVVKCTDPEAKKWEGWGTALKPAHEPIALARKPMKGSIAKNCQQWGVGALNIDGCRIQRGSDEERFPSNVIGEIAEPYQRYFYCPKVSRRERHMGFELPPAMFGNVQGCYDENGERFAVGFDNRAEGKTKKKKHDPLAHIPTDPSGMLDKNNGTRYIDGGKKEDLKQGVISNDEMVEKMGGYYVDENGNRAFSGKNIYLPHKGMIFEHGLKHEYQKWCQANGIDLGNVGNNHPTVKPIELMKYLIKLVTAAGGHVLDPFCGSGSTGCAARDLGLKFTGIELDQAYAAIARRRIQTCSENTDDFERLFDSD